jgi:hypothetical protein
MIEHCCGKGARHVTKAAIFACCDVSRILADCSASTTIMTAVTSFTDNFGAGMVYKSISEISGVMANPAIFASGLMYCCTSGASGSSSNIITTTIMA